MSRKAKTVETPSHKRPTPPVDEARVDTVTMRSPMFEVKFVERDCFDDLNRKLDEVVTVVRAIEKMVAALAKKR